MNTMPAQRPADEQAPPFATSADALTIGEVAARSGYNTSALRYYESEGLIESRRTDGNQRRYGRAVLRRLAFIAAARRVGLTLDEIAETLALLPSGRNPTREDWAGLSQSWRSRLDAEIDALEQLRDGLDKCIGCGCLSLDRCSLSNPGDVAGRGRSGAAFLPRQLHPAPET